MRDLHPCPPCGRQGRPGQGFLAGFIERPRGSAPRERDHRGGDHPVPSRTRQLSPPSPRVLQRKAAGGQGVALAEGAFLFAPFGRRPPTGRRSPLPGRARGCAPAEAGVARRTRRERPAGGIAPCGPFLRSAKVAESPAALRALPVPFCAAGSLAGRAYSWTAPLAGFLSLCAASRFSFLLVPKGLIDGYNLKTMYSSLAQCWCMGMRDL